MKKTNCSAAQRRAQAAYGRWFKVEKLVRAKSRDAGSVRKSAKQLRASRRARKRELSAALKRERKACRVRR